MNEQTIISNILQFPEAVYASRSRMIMGKQEMGNEWNATGLEHDAQMPGVSKQFRMGVENTVGVLGAALNTVMEFLSQAVHPKQNGRLYLFTPCPK